MNIKKRENYGKTLTLNGIDTLSGYVDQKITDADIDIDIQDNIKTVSYKAKKDKTLLQINPNKMGKKEHLITKYSEFIKKMIYILDKLGSRYEDFSYIRADFCFNSRDTDSYELYKKTNRLILLCLSFAYAYKNTYETKDLWTGQLLSLAIKKDDSEAEYYNKYIASDGRDECANRLEIRSKRMNGSKPQKQFLEKWFERFDAALTSFDEVQIESNNQMELRWKSDQCKPKRERDYVSVNAFLMQNRDNIFTRKQMIDLIRRLDPEVNATKKADHFKDRHKIEYFSKKDLEYIITVLKCKIIEYFVL